MSTQISICRDGQQYGPYSVEELTAHLESGAVQRTDLGWVQGMEDWKPLHEIVEIESISMPLTERVDEEVGSQLTEPSSVSSAVTRQVEEAVATGSPPPLPPPVPPTTHADAPLEGPQPSLRAVAQPIVGAIRTWGAAVAESFKQGLTEGHSKSGQHPRSTETWSAQNSALTLDSNPAGESGAVLDGPSGGQGGKELREVGDPLCPHCGKPFDVGATRCRTPGCTYEVPVPPKEPEILVANSNPSPAYTPKEGFTGCAVIAGVVVVVFFFLKVVLGGIAGLLFGHSWSSPDEFKNALLGKSAGEVRSMLGRPNRVTNLSFGNDWSYDHVRVHDPDSGKVMTFALISIREGVCVNVILQ